MEAWETASIIAVRKVRQPGRDRDYRARVGTAHRHRQRGRHFELYPGGLDGLQRRGLQRLRLRRRSQGFRTAPGKHP
jgi:hypothetical protein